MIRCAGGIGDTVTGWRVATLQAEMRPSVSNACEVPRAEPWKPVKPPFPPSRRLAVQTAALRLATERPRPGDEPRRAAHSCRTLVRPECSVLHDDLRPTTLAAAS